MHLKSSQKTVTELKNYIKKPKNTMKITFKPKILLKYQSYDQKKCLAQWQNIWMFSLLTMFKTQIVKKFCTSKKKGPFHKSLRGLLFSITFFRTHFTPVYEKKVSCCKPHWSD